MLRKELPELLELTNDLKVKLTEVKNELEPLLQLWRKDHSIWKRKQIPDDSVRITST